MLQSQLHTVMDGTTMVRRSGVITLTTYNEEISDSISKALPWASVVVSMGMKRPSHEHYFHSAVFVLDKMYYKPITSFIQRMNAADKGTKRNK